MQRIFTKNRVILAAAVIAGFGLGAGVTMLSTERVSDTIREIRDSGGYTYINPLLACTEAPGLLPKEVRAAEQEVQSILDEYTSRGVVTEAGVYYRDLTNGPWFGINEDATFVPGSLLKVPMMLAYLKELERDPSIATKEILYEKQQSQAIQNIEVAHPLVIGERYTPDFLLERMITESDNESAYLLYTLVGSERVGEIYTQFGLSAPLAGRDYSIRVRDYATFFRVLYNATYLTPESSERALRILASTQFDTGIMAGVPAGTPVANKFGERRYGNDSAIQLHDCGIVYAPERPYLLCVMTRGTDIASLSKMISEISRTVYSRVTST